MVFLLLFYEFFKTGLFAIGGGLATLPFLYDIAEKYTWFDERMLSDMIAISESTPGPLAVNMATFIGASQGGFPGALCATLGVVLPAFIIILVIAALIQNLLRFAGVQAFLSGVRPCVVGLILATALTMGLKTLFSFSNLGDNPVPDWRGILLFALMPLTAWGYKRLRKKPLSPILLILLSAGLGMLFYGL